MRSKVMRLLKIGSSYFRKYWQALAFILGMLILFSIVVLIEIR